MCPLRFGELKMKEKEQDVYLGDVLSSRGQAASVEATIANRMGRIKGSIYETAAILKDWRMQCVGGMMGAWDIWEMSIIPSLLANGGSWVVISQRAIDRLPTSIGNSVRFNWPHVTGKSKEFIHTVGP